MATIDYSIMIRNFNSHITAWKEEEAIKSTLGFLWEIALTCKILTFSLKFRKTAASQCIITFILKYSYY